MTPFLQMNPLASPTVPARAKTGRQATPRRRPPWNFAEWFILSQTFFPALLYLPGTQPLRIPIRVAAYGLSLAALVYFWSHARGREKILARPHPSLMWLLVIVVYLGLMVIHPTTNSLIAGVAQVCLYVSILVPVVWAPACVENAQRLNRLLWLLLVCNGINSFVGVMQVNNPGLWMPREFSSNVMDSEYGLGTAIYEGADGSIIIRPPGLGDAPGAVSGPAVFALYLGLVCTVTERVWWKKVIAVVFACLGAEAIFLSLVRSYFLIAVGMIVAFVFIQLSRRRFTQALTLTLIAVAAIAIAFVRSSATGGDSLIERFKSITEEDPMSFYYENRGNQVADGFKELLPKYPLGAGLGRYGMMNAYFGNNNAASPPIWVEIQWPAWIVDGGFIMLLLYPVALGVAMWQQAKAAYFAPKENVRQLGSIILAANMGLLALCFSYPVFLSPMGIQFWFLTGALYSVSLKPGAERMGGAVRKVSGVLPFRNVTKPAAV